MTVEIIAEIGVNYETLEEAKGMIALAKMHGADMAKFQYFREQDIENHPLRERLLPLCLTPLKAKELIDEGVAMKIPVFFTPENEFCVNDLELAGNPIYKIGHNNCMNMRLLNFAYRTGKPLIISFVPGPRVTAITSTIVSVQNYRNPFVFVGTPYKLLYCNPSYPTKDEDVHLPKEFFPNSQYDGFSDHTQGTTAAIAAVARGAQIIEKHVMLAGTDPIDRDVSIGFSEFEGMINHIRRIEKICC